MAYVRNFYREEKTNLVRKINKIYKLAFRDDLQNDYKMHQIREILDPIKVRY